MEIFETFKVFKNEVENQLGKTIKALRSDRGGEYISQEFKDYLKPCGIVQQLTPPYTPQHNGVSERRNCTLLDMVRSMMNLTTLPLSFWDYSLESAARILNMVPTKKVDKTPYELWFGKVPNLSYLKVWGCEVLVKRDTPDKLQQRYFKKSVGGRRSEEIQMKIHHHTELTSEYTMELKVSIPPQEEEVYSPRPERPHRDTNAYLDAMNAEMQSMKDNQVWRLVDLPPNGKIVGSKWLFKKKTDIDGNVHTYKARLVAKGFTQTYGVDYEETFSPVADIRAIRILISIAVFYDYEIWQMDVKTAFLNGYPDEDIYMVQPKGFIDPKHLRKVCKLPRSIYGLKQASRSWNKRFDEEIKRMDNSKRGYITMQERLDLNRTKGALTPGENPSEPHWTAVKTILKYLRNTKDMFLVYGGNPEAKLRVHCYCDAGFETDIDDTKSQTGYVFILNGGAVDWKSSKQTITAMSATEAEYIAASEAEMEAV
ncbi:retrotransposon protein, putative, ty1-copia subclass [Tanacetum coccineum]